jgi:threonine/homoserine/homoserine lactone efflux protein
MFLKGILIGLIFGVPVGAVGAMTVQRTWEHGIKAGLLTGMGSSIADCIYAAIGAFGLTIISDFLLQYQGAIHLVGGTIVLFMGIRLIFRKGEADVPAVTGKVRMFLSSFAVGITNPAAILTFLFAFSWFGIAGDNTKAIGWRVVLGVFVGTYLWWGGLAAAVALARKKKRADSFKKMNRIFGVVLSLFGILVFIRAIPI